MVFWKTLLKLALIVHHLFHHQIHYSLFVHKSPLRCCSFMGLKTQNFQLIYNRKSTFDDDILAFSGPSNDIKQLTIKKIFIDVYSV